LRRGAPAIAVMRLVVEDDDALEGQQLTAGAVQHLSVGFARPHRIGVVALQEAAAHPRELQRIAMLKGVVVGDHHLRLADLAQHVGGDQLAGPVIAVGVLGIEHLEAVENRDAGRHNQKCAREPVGLGGAHGVDRLPCDNHRHNRGLSGAGCHFQREPDQFRVGLAIGGVDRPPQVPVLAPAARHLGQPDQRLDRLDLTKERPPIGKVMVAPMFEQPVRGRRDTPIGPRELTPCVDMPPDLVDQGVFGVTFQIQGRLGVAAAIARNRHNELRRPSPLDWWEAERLTMLIKRMVEIRFFVRRIDDRLFVKRACHRLPRPVWSVAHHPER
jgi:hypothetical protein